MILEKLGIGNAPPPRKFTKPVLEEDYNKLVDDINSALTEASNQVVKLDQTTPQTFTGGIPLLESTHAEFTESHQLIDKEYADRVQSGGMKSFFFTKTASDVVTMYKADTTLPPGGPQTITGTAAEGETIIASFITDVAISPYRVIEGSRFFYLTAKASSITKPTQLRCYIYTTDVLGANPVLLRTSNLSTLLTTLDAQYITSVWGESLLIPITMRIKFVVAVIKSGGGADPTITLTVEDDTFSRLDVPSPTGVTDITGLVPYTGATTDVNLGTHSLGTDEIKTNTTAPTDLLITTGAQKTVVFATPTYRDEYPAMVIPASGAAAPDAVGHTIGGVARTLYGFDGNATQEILSGSIEIPHDYMIGQPIEVHVHWRPSTTGTGTVIWYFDYEYSPPNAAPIPQVTMSVEVNIASNKQYFHLLDSIGFYLICT